MKIIIKNDLTGQTKTVIVEDKFKSLSADMQNQTVNEISEQINWSKEPQVQKSQVQESVEESVQEEPKTGRIGSIARTLIESQAPILGLTRKKDIKEEIKNAAEILSYLPTPRNLTAKSGFALKKVGEILPQASLGGVATYIGERQKGAYEDEAKKTAAKGALLEIALGGAIESASATTKGIGKFITRNIPDDLYQKAKKFSKDTAVSVEKRIEQITNLGKKALKDNEMIAKRVNKKALNASNKNKIIANSLADNMLDLGKEFKKKNTPEGKISLIKNISEQDLSNAIQAEYDKLLLRAEPLIENGGISRNIEAEELLKDFKKRFMTTKKVKNKRIIPDPSGYDLAKIETYTEEIVRPIKDRKKFFKEMRLITDSSTWGEGKSAIKQSYARVHDSLNNFLKDNSEKYKEHKNLGQDLVNFSDYKVDIVDEYDANKLQDALKKSLSTFEKQPDIRSSKIIERVLDQANKIFGTKYKIKDFIKKFDQNEQLKLLKNEGNLSDSQLNLLDKNSRKIYQDNKDLGKVTKKGFFKPEQDVKQFVEGQEGTGLTGSRLSELLDPKLREQIEIEQAGRFFKQPLKVDIPINTIATPTVRALNALRGAIRLPRTQFQIKKLLEGDSVTTKRLGLGARTLGRAAAREAVRSDEQKKDVVLDKRNQPIFIKRESFPNKITRNKSGKITNQEKIKSERGIIK